MIDYYEILQVSPRAEPEIIEAAYKRLALKYHPDTNSTPSASERMKWINQAYALLSDPAQRAQYDAARSAYRATQRPSPSSSNPPSASATNTSRTSPAAPPSPSSSHPSAPSTAANTSRTATSANPQSTTAAKNTSQNIPSRPKPRRLRACLTLVVLIALAASALWALQYYDLFRISNFIPNVP